MKLLLTGLILLYSMALFAQQESVAGKVYVLKNFPQTTDKNRTFRQILKGGSTNVLENLRIHYSTLKPKHELRPSHIQKDEEELIIVREGKLTVTINKKNKNPWCGQRVAHHAWR